MTGNFPSKTGSTESDKVARPIAAIASSMFREFGAKETETVEQLATSAEKVSLLFERLAPECVARASLIPLLADEMEAAHRPADTMHVRSAKPPLCHQLLRPHVSLRQAFTGALVC
eukprot:SAG31_NODE_5462_length_2523_cov_2.836634_2_plen_116_part_00